MYYIRFMDSNQKTGGEKTVSVHELSILLPGITRWLLENRKPTVYLINPTDENRRARLKKKNSRG